MTQSLEIGITHRGGEWETTLSGADELIERAATAAWNATVAADAASGGAELSIVLADNAFMRTLNRQYRGKDRPTNVLSFPADDSGAPDRRRILGDVVLALETLVDESREQGKFLGDHVCHMVVHGVLHLLGHDHETGPDADAMEDLEIRILADMGIANPYMMTETPLD